MSQGERRFLPGFMVLPWLVLAGSQSFAAEGSAPQTGAGTTVSTQSAASIAACEKAAEHQAAEAKGWHSGVEWTEARVDSDAKGRVTLSGRAQTATGWTAFTARCEFDKHHRASASLDPEPVRPTRGRTIDLSAAGAVPAPKPARVLPLSPDLSDRSTNENSGSSQVKGTLSEIRPDIPTAPLKKQDFLHDHRLGIKIDTPF